MREKLRGNGSGSWRLRLSAKPNAEASFVPVCEQTVTEEHAAKGGYLTASVPWDSQDVYVWRADIFAEDLPEDSNIQVEFLTDQDPERDRKAFFHRLYLPGKRFVCIDGAKWKRGASPGINRAFVARSGLRIVVEDPEKLLSAADRKAFDSAVMGALLAWRRVCQDCNEFNIASLRIDGRIYMLDDFAEWLREGPPVHSSQKQQFPPPPGPLGEGLARAKLANRIGARGIPSEYEEVSTRDIAFRNLCNTPYDKLIPDLRVAWKALGCGEKPDRVALLLSLRSARTSCGDDPNIVACNSDLQLVELNAKDYSFRLGKSTFGSGKRLVDLELVLAHEAGHWIGLGHIPSEEGMMNNALETIRCVDNATAERLNAFARGEKHDEQQKLALYFENPD